MRRGGHRPHCDCLPVLTRFDVPTCAGPRIACINWRHLCGPPVLLEPGGIRTGCWYQMIHSSCRHGDPPRTLGTWWRSLSQNWQKEARCHMRSIALLHGSQACAESETQGDVIWVLFRAAAIARVPCPGSDPDSQADGIFYPRVISSISKG